MSRIMIVGEAWGEVEERQRQPFVGASGYELTRMLTEAKINRRGCYLTNVFNLHPPGNDLDFFCGPKSEAIHGYPQLSKGGWVSHRFQGELNRLSKELVAEAPNIVIALGNTAMWATLGKTTIKKFRGTTATSSHTAMGFKVLPTYHPAAVLRQWELRPLVIADFTKALREAAFPEVRRPEVTIHVPQTVQEITQFKANFIDGAPTLAVDIETYGTQVTCIGFAPSKSCALVVPIYDLRRKSRSYWDTGEHERQAWKAIREILTDPRPSKVFQNGLYDIGFLWRSYGIKVRGAEHDTMLLHHALQPESLKGLGFLGSVYTDHGPWKMEREHTKTIKRDE